VITIQDQDPGDFDPRLGKQLGGYIVAARVADGAMGRVYEGRQPETKARVAIKVLHDAVAHDRVAVERFKREYETAKELDNPYIVKVLEFGDTPDRSHFMTMEYLEGEELGKAIAHRRPLPFARIVRVVSQVALGLSHAHSYGFIHRDLKPDNIFLCTTPDGAQVRLLDFGSVKLQVETGAKLTALGTTLGSPYYMSPEQATGATDVDERSDVFALGAILYEMLTAKTAFDAPTVAMILMKILNQSPPPPSTLNPASTQAIDSVVERALRKEKEDRFPTARALADALIAAFGLSGSCDVWATTSEAEIAAALAKARSPEPARSQPAAAPVASPAAPPARRELRTSAAPARESDVALSVPKQTGHTKLLVAVAIGIVVLGLIMLIVR
jgi:serine/threonine-protein kinase